MENQDNQCDLLSDANMSALTNRWKTTTTKTYLKKKVVFIRNQNMSVFVPFSNQPRSQFSHLFVRHWMCVEFMLKFFSSINPQ